MGRRIAIITAIFLIIPISISFSQSDKPPDNMVLIPAGTFEMGADSADEASPKHSVYIDSFYIDIHEVTNAEYKKFCDETERDLPEFWEMDKYHCGDKYPNHPVIGVTWYDAKNYAEWCGKRLPTEAEWEYAARGGLAGKKYPFGDEIDTTLANFSFQRLTKGPLPVKSYQPNGYGLYDMCGNVNEWVIDYFGIEYYKDSPDSNPPGPEKGKHRVIRGGGWHTGPYCSRLYFRNALPSNWVDFAVGFRCARDLNPVEQKEEQEE